MSGGVAYVYDPTAKLPDNLNAEMVELEASDDDDVEWLHGMHHGTRRCHRFRCGQRILADWPEQQTALRAR